MNKYDKIAPFCLFCKLKKKYPLTEVLSCTQEKGEGDSKFAINPVDQSGLSFGKIKPVEKTTQATLLQLYG